MSFEKAKSCIAAKWNALIATVRAHLVDDWKQLHKFYSVRAAAAGAVILTAWPEVPDDVKAALPGWVVQGFAYAVLFAAIAGAAVKQDLGKPPADDGGAR